jgi:hypothetical protein
MFIAIKTYNGTGTYAAAESYVMKFPTVEGVPSSETHQRLPEMCQINS